MKRLLLLLFILGCALTDAAALEPLSDPPPLAALLDEASHKNPSLLAAGEEAGSLGARAPQMQSLPDPQLSLSLLSYPLSDLRTDATPMTGNDIKLSQTFPYPGKLAAKGELARQQEAWAVARLADQTLQVRRQVREAWYLLTFQRRAISLTEANMRLLSDFISLTETRYQVGSGMQQNVLMAQVEHSRLLDRLLGLKRDADNTRALINSLAARPITAPLEEVPFSPAAGADEDFNRLQQYALENRPMFSAYTAVIAQYGQKVSLAELDYRPDFNVWASYRLRDDSLADGGDDFVSGGVSINLPFPVEKRRAAVNEAESGQRMARQQLHEFRRQLELDLQRGLNDLEQARTLTRLYGGGIIPQAEQAFNATLSAYQVDKVDFSALIEAQMTLYRYRIELARAEADVMRTLAQIYATVGLDNFSPAMAKKDTR